MKLKLVLVGRAWRQDKTLLLMSEFLYSDEFMDKVNEILDKTIPDSKVWGPAEEYYQLFDYGLPLGKHNCGKNGLTICLSQLYEKDGRLLEELSKMFLR